MLFVIIVVAFTICRIMYRAAKEEEAALERAGLAPQSGPGPSK